MTRAHPPRPTPPAEPGGGPYTDVVPGDPPVPITIWRTPAGDDQSSIPTRLAQRLVSAYSQPGEVVVDLTDAHPPPAQRTPVVAPGADGVRGATSLVVGGWPLHPVDARHRARLRGLLRAGVALLRPAGCLVLIVRPPASEALVPPEDFGPLVAAAGEAGLGYLQHIIAVRAEVDSEQGDRFVYHATDAELLALARDAARWRVAHLRVHADLLVFTPRHSPAGSGRGGARG